MSATRPLKRGFLGILYEDADGPVYSSITSVTWRILKLITFKSAEDLYKPPADDTIFPAIKELAQLLSKDYTWPGHPYVAEDYGFIVPIEEEDSSMRGQETEWSSRTANSEDRSTQVGTIQVTDRADLPNDTGLGTDWPFPERKRQPAGRRMNAAFANYQDTRGAKNRPPNSIVSCRVKTSLLPGSFTSHC